MPPRGRRRGDQLRPTARAAAPRRSRPIASWACGDDADAPRHGSASAWTGHVHSRPPRWRDRSTELAMTRRGRRREPHRATAASGTADRPGGAPAAPIRRRRSGSASSSSSAGASRSGRRGGDQQPGHAVDDGVEEPADGGPDDRDAAAPSPRPARCRTARTTARRRRRRWPRSRRRRRRDPATRRTGSARATPEVAAASRAVVPSRGPVESARRPAGDDELDVVARAGPARPITSAMPLRGTNRLDT